MNPAGHAGGHHHQPQPKWSLQMILMVNHWAASGRAAAKLKQDELNEVQQDKKQSERASSVLSVGSSSRHDTFFGKTLVDWIIQEYDEERDNSIQYGRQMILAGVIQNPSGAASIDFDSFKDDFSAFSLTSSFQRLMKIGKYQDSPKPSSSRSNNRTPKTTDQLEKIACIFREPPPNPSEIDVDTRNFIEEGLHFFSPPTFDKRLQEQLVSGIITMVGVISHITPPLSLPDDITGPPVLQIGTANFILINLTNIEEENTYLILSLPDHLSERQIRILGEDFQNNMRFLQGPFKVLAARLPEALLKKEVERTGTDLVQTMNISSTAMPIVPYTKSQTSILAYRLGSKCGQSTLGAYMKASHLVDKMMTRKGVLSAAVFNEGKVAAHEMTEELLKLIGISILEKASKVNDKGWSNNSDDNLPYLPQGFSNIRFDPLRYGLSLRHEKSSSNDTSDLIPIYLTKKQAEEFKGCDTEDTPSTLLPNYFKQNNDDGGKWFGLYLQHKELMCCVMIVPIKQLFGIINSSIDKQFRSVLAHSMAGLIQQGTVPQSVAPAESGSYAIWNQIDESFISNNSSTAFTSECAFAHFTIDDLKDEGQEVNRIILSKGPNSQYFAARNTANIKSFFETSQAGGQRSMSHTEEKAKEQIGVQSQGKNSRKTNVLNSYPAYGGNYSKSVRMLRTESIYREFEKGNDTEDLEEGMRRSFSQMCETIVSDRTTLHSGTKKSVEQFNRNFVPSHNLRYLMSNKDDPDKVSDAIIQFLTHITHSKAYRAKAVKRYIISARSVKKAFMNATTLGRQLREAVRVWWNEEEAKAKIKMRQRIQQYQHTGCGQSSSLLLSRYGGYSVAPDDKAEATDLLYRQRLLRFREDMQIWNSTQGKDETTLMELIAETKRWMESKENEKQLNQSGNWVTSPTIPRSYRGYLPEVGSKPLETASDLRLRLEMLTVKLSTLRQKRPTFEFTPSNITVRDLLTSLETVKQRQKIPQKTLENLHSACLVFKGPGALKKSPYEQLGTKRKSVRYFQPLPLVTTPNTRNSAAVVEPQQLTRKPRSRSKLFSTFVSNQIVSLNKIPTNNKPFDPGMCISAAQLAASSKKLLKLRKSSRPPNNYNSSVKVLKSAEFYSARVWPAAQLASCRKIRTPSAKKRMRENNSAQNENLMRPFLFFQNHLMITQSELQARLQLIVFEVSAAEELSRRFLVRSQIIRRGIIKDTYCILTAFIVMFSSPCSSSVDTYGMMADVMLNDAGSLNMFAAGGTMLVQSINRIASCPRIGLLKLPMKITKQTSGEVSSLAADSEAEVTDEDDVEPERLPSSRRISLNLCVTSRFGSNPALDWESHNN